MRGFLLSVALALTATLMAAQSVLPVKPRFDRIQWSELAADAGAHALDAYSTHYFLGHGYTEAILPDWISHSNGRMWAYSGIVVGANFLLAHELVKHHHPRLAKVATAIDVGFVTNAGISNLNVNCNINRKAKKR